MDNFKTLTPTVEQRKWKSDGEIDNLCRNVFGRAKTSGEESRHDQGMVR